MPFPPGATQPMLPAAATSMPLPTPSTEPFTPPPSAGPAGPPGAAPTSSPHSDPQIAATLLQRINKLTPQDIQTLDRFLTPEVSLILLKVIPELSPVILQGSQMQGPEMAPIKQAFNHDAMIAHLSGGAPQGPGAAAPQGPGAGAPSMPPRPMPPGAGGPPAGLRGI